MSEKLVATVENRRSGARVVKLEGVLDEDNELDNLIEKIGAGMALINLAGVERINSIGARDWVNWLTSIEAKGIRPVLICCSPAVVEQLNRIKNFAGSATVKSFHVPYHCAVCNLDKLLLVHVSEMGALPHRAPKCSCDSCGGPMTFTDESGTYFAFVGQLQKPRAAKGTPAHDLAQDLARGSSSGVTVEHVKRVSQPRITPRQSRPSLSAFQLADGTRASEQELTFRRPRPPQDRPYLLAIVALLLCTVGILVYLLIGR